MKKEKCINCKERDVFIKKRNLCKKCYANLYVNKKIDAHKKGDGKNINHTSEIEFIKNFFNHDNWIYEPVIFHLENEKYTPDFYDQETNTFIEVMGSRQAYYLNKEKYVKLKKLFPKINFEIRYPDGKLFEKLNFEIKLKSLGINNH